MKSSAIQICNEESSALWIPRRLPKVPEVKDSVDLDSTGCMILLLKYTKLKS